VTETMTDRASSAAVRDPKLDQKVVVVSIDGHIGPSTEQYRQYVPKKHLEEFDAYMAQMSARTGFLRGAQGQDHMLPPRQVWEMLDRAESPEHNDMEFRVQQMNLDGVASEVIYHGTNGIPIPFNGSFTSSPPVPDATPAELELRAMGMHVYNQVLADAILIAPERFVGVAHVPL